MTFFDEAVFLELLIVLSYDYHYNQETTARRETAYEINALEYQ